MADFSSPPQTPNPDDSTLRFSNDPRLSPVEADLLTEYAKLKENLDQLADQLGELAAMPSTHIADGLRQLERKTNVVCTALKASVYGIMLQHQIDVQEEGEQDDTIVGQ